MPGAGCDGPGNAQEHAWVRLMPWWHLAFAVTLLATAIYSAVVLYGTWRAPVVLGLYAVLGLLYLLTPGKFSNGPGRVVYVTGAFIIFGVAVFVFPGTSFLLFIFVPHCFMLSNGLRAAILAVIGLVLLSTGGTLAYDGVSAGSVAEVAGSGAFTLCMSLLLGGYITRIIDQSRQRADLIQELERTRAELAELSRQSGALAERERLARDIHDALAQGFTSVIMLLQAAEAALDRNDLVAARRQLALAEPAARDGLAEARSLIEALAPLPLQGAGLVEAVERVCHDVGARFGFASRLDVDGSARPLSHNDEIVLLRAAQEALVNVGRHAHARSAGVKLIFNETGVILEVVDDGVGFDAFGTAGFGLSQLRARVAELGGTAEVVSAPGQGTRVRVDLAAPAAPHVPSARGTRMRQPPGPAPSDEIVSMP